MPYLMINGVKQEFETFGDIHDPPLLMLYGSAVNQDTWRAWDWNGSIAKLAEENYVICYDRRGHGSSRFPQGTTLEDVAKDIFTLLDILCIDKANVCGYSAGTYLLGCAAGIAPERFNSMILLGANSKTENGSPAARLMREMGIDAAKATPEQMAKMARIGYAPDTPDSTIEAYDEWKKQFAQYPALPVEDCVAAYKSIANFDNRENFKKLKLPTLVIAGKYDVFCPPEVGKEIADSIDGGRYLLYEDCGHSMYYEQNDRCIQDMMEFLRSVRP